MKQGYLDSLDLDQKKLMDKTDICLFQVPDTLAALEVWPGTTECAQMSESRP